jgi:hypothetical protein
LIDIGLATGTLQSGTLLAFGEKMDSDHERVLAGQEVCCALKGLKLMWSMSLTVSYLVWATHVCKVRVKLSPVTGRGGL